MSDPALGRVRELRSTLRPARACEGAVAPPHGHHPVAARQTVTRSLQRKADARNLRGRYDAEPAQGQLHAFGRHQNGPRDEPGVPDQNKHQPQHTQQHDDSQQTEERPEGTGHGRGGRRRGDGREYGQRDCDEESIDSAARPG